MLGSTPASGAGAYVILVHVGLNTGWSNLLANHTTILVVEDACLPDLTPDEVIASSSGPTVVRKYLDRSLDAVGINDSTRAVSAVPVLSFDRRTRKMVDPPDALAQGAEGVKVDEYHQVLGNEDRLEEDVPYRTRVDDDGVEFSPEGGDYFPTIGDEIKKEKCSLFLLLLITCLVLMLMAPFEFSEQPTVQVVGPASEPDTLMQQGVGLDELKHDPSAEESLTHECKDVIVENEYEIISLVVLSIFLQVDIDHLFRKLLQMVSNFVLGAKTELNKADLEEVADVEEVADLEPD
ncbi:hypothetical protein Tco_0424040 [Tanacetum coccineum]